MFQGRNVWLLTGLSIFIALDALAGKPALNSSITDDKLIRVHIKSAKLINISGFGLNIDERIRFNQHKTFSMRCNGANTNGIVLIKSLGKFRSPLEFTSDNGFLFVDGKPYRRQLRIIAAGKKCLVVNISPLERYIAGVVAKEMHPKWPIEALKAQAVAARSYAVAIMKKPRSTHYDLASTTMDQVYSGVSGEDSRTLLAARATAGQVLHAKRKVLKAYYHSHCGGRTELPKNVWGKREPAYRSVSCPYHRVKQPQTEWRHELTKSTLQQKLKNLSAILPQSFQRLANLQVNRSINSNRVSTVTMADDKGNSLELEAGYFRKIIGNRLLKSTRFRIIDRKSSVEFKGSGFGHGVGLCQYGTKEMAKLGKNYNEILRHYYPLASLKKLY